MMLYFLKVFRDAEVICIPSASCVGMIWDHFPKMAAETGESGDPKSNRRLTALYLRIFRVAG
jgi:L-lactate dehydrogenase complex protein LldE